MERKILTRTPLEKELYEEAVKHYNARIEAERKVEEYEIAEEERKRFSKKKLMRMAAAGLAVMKVADVAQSVYDPFTTVDHKVAQVKLGDSRKSELDNDAPDFSDFTYVGNAEEEPIKIKLGVDDVIRTNNWDYTAYGLSPEDPNYKPIHTEIATAKEDMEFTISQGDIYKDKEGDEFVRIENFEKTSDGKYTGIKLNVDTDGWVLVDKDASRDRAREAEKAAEEEK